jgi:hypothetical protein
LRGRDSQGRLRDSHGIRIIIGGRIHIRIIRVVIIRVVKGIISPPGTADVNSHAPVPSASSPPAASPGPRIGSCAHHE